MLFPRAPGVVLNLYGPTASAAPEQSSCVGDEENVGQCLRAQLARVSHVHHGLPDIFKPSAKEVACSGAIIVGCATVSPQPLSHSASHASPQASNGIWIIGDRIDNDSKLNSALSNPRIFLSTGPSNCTVPQGKRLQWKEARNTKTNCSWGQIR